MILQTEGGLGLAKEAKEAKGEDEFSDIRRMV